MARILDFYGIVWEYEPHTFAILWNLDGDVVESFSPDFYLAELDLYLEMTTLRQKLVRKKNRKLRRLRELYPDVHIKLFYARDFRALMLKYGKLGVGRRAQRHGGPGRTARTARRNRAGRAGADRGAQRPGRRRRRIGPAGQSDQSEPPDRGPASQAAARRGIGAGNDHPT